jgi:hypothetical protein
LNQRLVPVVLLKTEILKFAEISQKEQCIYLSAVLRDGGDPEK